ncbi:hypothetical protein F9C07_6963 [Aspergillus flavus]|uniref:Uncharacterized protein n=1 Tax=Aspergillus flavus (strain ATCC 200026 / FGSC A1120 / IAM 13836 / NRRL 3357 / JCM 12722 / SRRC 167) TaxID=332952 RepID=A0A7U2MGQ8_ASPFN|nr:hypothetical protein F9C07_6963 [Aspergillus flavus]
MRTQEWQDWRRERQKANTSFTDVAGRRRMKKKKRRRKKTWPGRMEGRGWDLASWEGGPRDDLRSGLPPSKQQNSEGRSLLPL